MKRSSRIVLRVGAILVLAATISGVVLQPLVNAAQITNRSLTLEAGTTDGGSKPGGVVKHLFAFTLPSSTSVASIQFQYCTLAAGTCVTPTGLVTTSATLNAQTGSIGFTIVNTTNGSPYITKPVPASANGAVTYELANVTNPTTANQTFFVRINSFASTDASGSPVDSGVVAASTASQIILSGIMPESLVFCTGATIGLTNSVPDCATATSGTIAFNQLFSPTDTAISTSQMAASTNAGSGYSITVNGPTLTSGSNTISGMATTDTSKKGVSQFGLNLVTDTAASASSFGVAPPTGYAATSDVAPISNGTNYRAQPLTGYGTPDSFTFIPGLPIANSSNGALGGSDAQIYTVSYIANVPGSQPAGTYTTTLTYICTPTY